MKHLMTFESLYELPVILELKDMALELTDMAWNIQIFKDQQYTNENVRVIITHRDNFTMTDDIRDFLFRIIGYMEENGYEYDTHSNYGRLHFVNDGRVIISSGEARSRYPSFTMINILFKKT